MELLAEIGSLWVSTFLMWIRTVLVVTIVMVSAALIYLRYKAKRPVSTLYSSSTDRK